ncbi:hypothetical protein Btru_007853 [Bulinus truncatus]|nr:hypothetical protein Btru_007853 [Bulinus truncatus]
MDIYFVLDSSTSIWVKDYEKLHPFIRNIVSGLDIGASKTRVGVLAYSIRVNKSPEPLRLNRFYNKRTLKDYITMDNFPYMTGITNTFDAIRYVRENLDFKEDVTKVMIILTDGYSSDPRLTAAEAALARDQGFYIFVIGLGQYQDAAEWRTLADDPDRDFMYNVSTFQFTESLKLTLTRRACTLLPKPSGGICRSTPSFFTSLYYISGSGSSLDNAYYYSNNFAERTRGSKGNIVMGFFFQNCDRRNVPFGRADDICPRTRPSSQTPLSTLIANAVTAATDSRRDNGEHNKVAVIVLDDAGVLALSDRHIVQLQNVGIEVILVDLSTRLVGIPVRNALTKSENYIRFVGLPQTAKEVIERTCTSINRPPPF